MVLAEAAAMPDVRASVTVSGWTMTVEAVDGHRITRVRLAPLGDADTDRSGSAAP
ncbi:MAG: transporter associated domain-containing protein [Acidimicrobiia bacterium]